MGQIVGHLPNTWDRLLQEKDRVLYWSGEVLARVADNVNQELSLLIDYGEESIDEKVDSWIRRNRWKVDKVVNRYPNMAAQYETRVQIELAKIRDEFRIRMRNEYRHAYKDIKEFTKKVDKLGKRQRKIHGKIHKLETICDGDVKRLQKKLGSLRLETFQNLKTGEKMMFEDRRLKAKFAKRVHEIDHKNLQECTKRVDKLCRNIENVENDWIKSLKEIEGKRRDNEITSKMMFNYHHGVEVDSFGDSHDQESRTCMRVACEVISSPQDRDASYKLESPRQQRSDRYPN